MMDKNDMQSAAPLGKKQRRQQKILSLLQENSHMSCRELQQQCGCSEATMRNDLRQMEHDGLLRRTFGGACCIHITPATLAMPSVYMKQNLAEKEAIARFAADTFVRPDQTLLLDLGGSSYALASYLVQRGLPLDVVTNSLVTAGLLARAGHIWLHLPGGVYNREIDSFDVPSSLEYYRNIHVQHLFLGANGINDRGDITVNISSLATHRLMVKRAMVNSADKVVLLCDHSKIGKSCFYKVCSIDQIDCIVTDDGCDESQRQMLSSLGLPVYYAPLDT